MIVTNGGCAREIPELLISRVAVAEERNSIGPGASEQAIVLTYTTLRHASVNRTGRETLKRQTDLSHFHECAHGEPRTSADEIRLGWI